jgi:hypothetical protein
VGVHAHGAIGAEGRVAHQIEAQRFGAALVQHLEGVQHVAQRLAHLAPVGPEQEAWTNTCSGIGSSAAIRIAGQNTVWNFDS